MNMQNIYTKIMYIKMYKYYNILYIQKAKSRAENRKTAEQRIKRGEKKRRKKGRKARKKKGERR